MQIESYLEDSLVRVQLINHSNETFKVTDKSSSIQLIVTQVSTGKRIPYCGPLFKVMHNFVDLGPGESRHYQVNLQLYAIIEPGEYSITPVYVDPLGEHIWSGIPLRYHKS